MKPQLTKCKEKKQMCSYQSIMPFFFFLNETFTMCGTFVRHSTHREIREQPVESLPYSS